MTKSLINIKGIGPWTLDMYDMFVHKNLDHFLFKDLGLIESIKYMYPEPLQTIDEIKKSDQTLVTLSKYCCTFFMGILGYSS